MEKSNQEKETTDKDIKEEINNPNNVKVINDSKELLNILLEMDWENANLLLMSSGNFDGLDYQDIWNRMHA